jgi:hypothetical protein
MQEAERDFLVAKIDEYERHAWVWTVQAALCVLVVLLILLPIPLMLLNLNVVWMLGLAALIFFAAGIVGGLLEIVRPIGKVRQVIFSMLMICTFGFLGRMLPGRAAADIGTAMGAVGILGLMTGGAAFGFLRSIDRWRERALYLRLKLDTATGTVWGFGELHIENKVAEIRLPLAEILPRSGVVVSLQQQPFPAIAPMLPMATAPRPTRTWEIPSHIPPPPGLRRSTRLMTASERIEGAAAVSASRKRAALAALGLLFSGALFFVLVVLPRATHTPEAELALRLLAFVIPGAFFWMLAKFWIKSRRFAADIKDGKVEVFRPVEASDEDPPLAEVLPRSRFIWMWRGRLGPIRLVRQEPGVKG